MSVPVFLTSPLPPAIIVLAVAALAWRRLPRWSHVAIVVFELSLVALMTPLGAAGLARVVERHLTPQSTCLAPVPRVMVVLGGGFARAPDSPDDFSALQAWSVQRVFAGVALWHALPGSRLVFAGGGREYYPEAVAMGSLAQHLGVPANAITLETKSRDTWENARNVAALSPALPKRVWLVTSALHMPRSLAAFRAWGFDPCAWPSDPVIASIRFRWQLLIPSGAAVDASARALHELVGAVDYAWKARQHRRALPVGKIQTP